MPLQVQDLKQHFPPGVNVPDLLIRLLEYQNQLQQSDPQALIGFINDANFQVCDCGDSVQRWFGREEPAEHFVVFGSTRTGSLVGYWLYEGQTVESAPIVLLDSEGLGYSGVIANSLPDFLALIALGEDGWVYGEEPAEPTAALIHYREWLRRECGIATPRSSEEIEDKIDPAHPDLADWLEGRG